MDPVVRLQAVEGIKAAKARQQRGVDTNDRDLLLHAFTDDVVADCRGIATDPSTGFNLYPDPDLVFRGIEAAVASGMSALDNGVATHHVSNPEIEIASPTTGTAIWPHIDRLRFKDGAPYKEVIGYGFYHDTYERVAEDWRIKTMRTVRIRVDVIPW
ncbi:nuclear transport factor 2 family protein [Geodermatophilus sp. URMC 64]